eukprot:4226457-Ditylum_brightwellii.AAC.1
MGWMLSLLPWFMEDCKKNSKGLHQLALERVIDKLYVGNSVNAIEKVKNDFWTKWDDFVSKQGDSYGQQHIWSSNNLCDGCVHLRQQQILLPFTSVLGYIACQIMSKILGIGAAGRLWGDVKCIKTGKHLHIKNESLKKQSVIF